jgi:hypothetical protein
MAAAKGDETKSPLSRSLAGLFSAFTVSLFLHHGHGFTARAHRGTSGSNNPVPFTGLGRGSQSFSQKSSEVLLGGACILSRFSSLQPRMDTNEHE